MSLPNFVTVTLALIQARLACLHINTSCGLLTPSHNVNSLCQRRSMDTGWIKGKIMAQWMNLYWNDSFINLTRLPLLFKKSGAILLVLVDLMAGRPAVR